MALNVVNFSELEWKEWMSQGVRFGAQWAPLADRLGARKLGYGSWIVPPGKASVPYHYHLVNEELAIVLGGEVWLRLNGAFHLLQAGDAVAFPPGADSAHQLLNHADRPAHVLMASTRIPREVVVYPDSGKRGYAVAGLASDPPMERVMTKDGRIVEGIAGYFEGEPVDEPLGDAPGQAGERDSRIVRSGLASVFREKHQIKCRSAPSRSCRLRRLPRSHSARHLQCPTHRREQPEHR